MLYNILLLLHTFVHYVLYNQCCTIYDLTKKYKIERVVYLFDKTISDI